MLLTFIDIEVTRFAYHPINLLFRFQPHLIISIIIAFRAQKFEGYHQNSAYPLI